jgi:uncharacterized coiled-coil protein SlyX
MPFMPENKSIDERLDALKENVSFNSLKGLVTELVDIIKEQQYLIDQGRNDIKRLQEKMYQHRLTIDTKEDKKTNGITLPRRNPFG